MGAPADNAATSVAAYCFPKLDLLVLELRRVRGLPHGSTKCWRSSSHHSSCAGQQEHQHLGARLLLRPPLKKLKHRWWTPRSLVKAF